MMLKSKIFFGLNQDNQSADCKLNQWLVENPNVEILDFKYQHTTAYWHHSICILYKEEEELDGMYL